MTVLTKIMERLGVRQADAETKYAGFVTLAADGKDFDLDALVRLLIVTGGTMEDFDAAVERVERRRSAHAMLADATNLEPSLEPATKKAAGLRAKEEEVRRQCEQAMREAESAASAASDDACEIQRQIDRLRSEGKAALLGGADPSLQTEISRLEARSCDARYEGNSIGRSPHCDPAEVAKAHRELGEEEARLQARIDELRQQQVA